MSRGSESAQVAPYGLWPSPIGPDSIAGQARIKGVDFSGEALVWCEGRDGRGQIVVQRGVEAPRIVTDRSISVSGGVGYGGGEFACSAEAIYFAASDGRLWRAPVDPGLARPLTPAFGRVASPAPSPNGAEVAFVNTYEGVDAVGVVSAEGGWPERVGHGADFYMQPAWSPDGATLAWIAWDHPHMPWDEARVEWRRRGPEGWGELEVVAGAPGVSMQQPVWSPDGAKLAYLSDEGGWWGIVVRDLASGEEARLGEEGSDHATPAWVQGLRHFAWRPDSGAIVAAAWREGAASLVEYELGGAQRAIEAAAGYTSIASLVISRGGSIAFVGATESVPSRVARIEEGRVRIAHRSSSESVPAGRLARPQAVAWPSVDGQARGVFYPPVGPFSVPAGDRPPVVLMVHGGPTSAALQAYSAKVQFFATRGWAVLDVNYRGSTGYGRAYMEALRGRWGELDMEDAARAVSWLADEGLADPKRAVIMGGSAGGYTVLRALSARPGVFAAGVCMYGISNLFSLAEGTHKFESRYNDGLLGALPGAAEVWRERSPIFSAQMIADPVAIFHGKEDRVVPIDQAEAIVAALRARGVPHAYHIYEGEGHGWRKAETIEHFYRTTLSFLREHVIYR